MIDGFKEGELRKGGNDLGTTRKGKPRGDCMSLIISRYYLEVQNHLISSLGIGPTYSSKASRSGLRVCDLFHPEDFEAKFRQMVANKIKRYGEFDYDVEGELAKYKVHMHSSHSLVYTSHQELAKKVEPYVIDSVKYCHDAIKSGKRVLVEGANALMLDIDFGTYPYVTSSNTGVGGVCTGLGIPPKKVDIVIGVAKAYTTRVGAGPFPTEQLNVKFNT